MMLRLVAAGTFLSMIAIICVVPDGVGSQCQLGSLLEGSCDIEPWRGAVLLAIAVLSGVGLAKLLQQFAAPQTLNEVNARHDIEPDLRCPACGSEMQLRIARRGKQRGGYFMGCKRYPICYGTASASEREIAQDLRRQIAATALPVPLDATDEEVIEATRRYAAFLPDLKLPERWREESAAHHRSLTETPQEAPSPGE